MKVHETILAELTSELTDFSTRLTLMDKNMAKVLENTNTFSTQVENLHSKIDTLSTTMATKIGAANTNALKQEKQQQ